MTPGSTTFRPDDTPLLLAALGTKPSAIDGLIRSADHVTLIAGGGSDRQFFRLAQDGKTVIVMVSPLSDQEFSLYLEIGYFLRSIGVGTPEVYEAYPESHVLVMEDLGDTSLHEFLRDEHSEEVIVHWYAQVLDTLLHLQIDGSRQWDSCPAVTGRALDYSVLRWETEYFFSSFITQYCDMRVSNADELNTEFHRLAVRVAAEPLFVMHRDFQSQNIMIHQGSIRIIDFQGARKGLLQYDLASLLKDPYAALPAPIEQKLVDAYLNELRTMTCRLPSVDEFHEVYTLASLQRIMQALGAFSFLSRTKGKTWFEQFIPTGVHNLATMLRGRTDFPVLRALAQQILEKMDGRW